MRIQLLHPFDTIYRNGYLRTNREGRKVVDLFNSNEDRTTVSYARYLVSVREGRILKKEEEVDHIDGDKTNDALENLGLLHFMDHRQKTIAERPKMQFFEFTCPVCKTSFRRRKGRIQSVEPKCSRRCNGLASRMMQLSKHPS